MAMLHDVERTNETCSLSFGQKRLWFLGQLSRGDAAYNLSKLLFFDHDLDIPILRRALEQIVARHECLRSIFVSARGDVVREVDPTGEVDLRVVPLDSQRPRDAIERMIRSEIGQPFRLDRGPLFRAVAYTGRAPSLVLLCMHHIVADGWSLEVLQREILEVYGALRAGRPFALTPMKARFSDFIAKEQTSLLHGPTADALLDFWTRKLANVSPLVSLPSDHPRELRSTSRGAWQQFRVSAELAQELRAIGGRARATLFMTLLTALGVFVHRFTGVKQIPIGTPVANRKETIFDNVVGPLANTIVVVCDVDAESSFMECLCSVRETTLDAFAAQEMPFERLVQRLAPVRSLTHNPLFQVMFTLDTVSTGNGSNDPGSDSGQEQHDSNGDAPVEGTTKFDWSLAFVETQGRLCATVEYSTELYEHETVRLMVGEFQQLLRSIVRDPDEQVERLALLDGPQQQQLLRSWGVARERDPIEFDTVHSLFEAQVQFEPDRPAVVCGPSTLSYAELNAKANALAHHLIGLGVRSDTLVGLCVQRGPDMMVGVLGILKAGAAYLPLDPSYPPQRLRYMLEDSQVALLVTRAEISVLPTQGVQCVYLQDLETRADLDTSNPQRQLHSQQLAYVIYTSGSTGQPKGVMVEHRGLCNLAQAQREVVQLPRGSRLLQFSSLSFDIWMWDFLLAIGSGSALCVVTDPWQCSGAQLVQQMVAYEVTALTLPPSVLSTLPTAELPSLKTVIVGAEVCSAELVRRWAQGRRFFNGYGPTEASVTATMAECRADGSKPTIGRAFRNVRVYVLDSALSPVAPGVPGEVYIGGVGVARGYLNRPELTAQRFIEDPFTSGERLYRTGDRARYLYNGELEFLGRIDDQVKVRGYRVEPQEVAILLKAHSAVQDAAVVVETRDDQPARLVAYVALKPDHEATRAELRSHLARSLPDYMLPSATVFLPALPLTPNGKLDPTALPRLDSQRPELDQPFVAPSSPTELMIAQIWARALQIERIGVHDDFFDLGGHSLLATQVASRLEDAFGHPVPVRTLFESPTIAKLAERMVATNETTVDHVDLRSGTRRSATIPRRTNPATFPTSFGQDRIWFLEQLNPRSPAYIICSAVRVGPVSFDILKSALGELMNRHDVLRARFEQRGGVPIQLIEEALQPPLMRVEYCTTSEAERATIARRLVEEEYCSPFELTKAPLFRATLAVFDDADHLLVIAIHHIIADAWSMSILFKELAAFYDHLATGRPADLPSLPIQYSDYAAWQRELFSRDGLRPQLDYWRSALAGAPPTTTLPLDFPRPPAQQFEGMRQSFVYSPTLYAAIQRQARRHGASSYMVMLAAFIATLAHFSGAEDLVIGSPIAARNRIETESLIGFFANTVAIRSRLSRDLSFEALLVAVREATLLAHANQDVPFDAVVNALQVTRTRSHNPVFQVLFNLQSEDTVGLRDSDPQLVPAQVLLSDSPVLTRGFPKFDLELGLTIVPHAICVMLEYNSSLFLDETITRFALDYRATIEQVTANPELRLCDIRFTNRSVQSLPELEEETLFSFEEATA